MARTATKYDNHQNFGNFPLTGEGDDKTLELVEADGLTHEIESVVASDKETQRSGELSVPVYKAETLQAALALYNGSHSELAIAAVNAFNDRTRASAKAEIVKSIIGPEKALARTIKRVAKALGIDAEVMTARVKENPQYLDMLVSLAK